MKIAILGFAREGQAAYDYFRNGNDITICDMNENLKVPDGVKTRLGIDHLKNLDEFDLIVRTAVLKPKIIQEANPNSPNLLDKVTTNTNEFLKVCPTKNTISVTGTKGKGTTSTLIAKMLEADGKKVHLGGNIGIAPLEMLKQNIQSDDWVVLEEGAFQIVDQDYSPHIGVCLMIASEHMDWFDSMAEYVNAKAQLFAHQKPEDIAIYLANDINSGKIVSTGQAKKIPFFAKPGAFVEANVIKIENKEICSVEELKLLGKHNWQNVCAAVTTVWQVTQNVEAIRSVLRSFTGLEHRLEFVREFKGVKYYDDSFGTTPETAIVAIQAFSQPKVVILGGADKGSNYDELGKVVASGNVKKVVLIGKMAPNIRQSLNAAGFHDTIDGGDTMEEIVKAASQSSTSGDVVLLSTACASFGLFKDYKDRGDQFKQTVLALS